MLNSSVCQSHGLIIKMEVPVRELILWVFSIRSKEPRCMCRWWCLLMGIIRYLSWTW